MNYATEKPINTEHVSKLTIDSVASTGNIMHKHFFVLMI